MKMRLNVRTFVVTVILGAMLWIIFMMVISWMDGLHSGSPYHRRDTEIVSKILSLEKTVANQIEESKHLLKQLREKLKDRAEERKQNRVKQKDKQIDDKKNVLPVLVMACNRVSVSRCLDKLMLHRPSADTFPIVISQDCDDKPTRDVINNYVNSNRNVHYISQKNQTEIMLPIPQKKFVGYYKIARHYKFALTHMLDVLGYDNVIIVEDDLDIAPDFFEYFLGTYPLLQKDPSLWCISAWNDNGKLSLIDMTAPELLHRTDFFPGLGWMLTSKHWRRFRDKWPKAFFDDWLREPEQTGGYSCIRPEISRTSTFGKVGVSKGMFFDRHLRFIQLNKEFVKFSQLDLSYLLKDTYDKRLLETLASATPVSAQTNWDNLPPGDAKILYDNEQSFAKIAKQLGLMDDFRGGIARTAYNGVVSCYYRKHRVFIAPETPFTGYNKTGR